MKRLLFLTVLIMLTQCSSRPEDLSRGEQLFRIHCASCHGPKGEGSRGPALAVPKLFRAPTQESLIEVIRNGIAGTEMPRSRLSPDELKQLAAWVRGLGQSPVQALSGDAEVGKRLYFGNGKCAECHSINGWGGTLGPDLTGIGVRRSTGYLRAALTDPEADVPTYLSGVRPDVRITQNFLQVRLVSKDGRKLSAVRVNEDTFSIQVRDATGQIHSFFKSDLIELHRDEGKSPMPSYRGIFSKTELEDIVAFLAALRGEG
jgi:putative heme-binding domain-containing protein